MWERVILFLVWLHCLQWELVTRNSPCAGGLPISNQTFMIYLIMLSFFFFYVFCFTSLLGVHFLGHSGRRWRWFECQVWVFNTVSFLGTDNGSKNGKNSWVEFTEYKMDQLKIVYNLWKNLQDTTLIKSPIEQNTNRRSTKNLTPDATREKRNCTSYMISATRRK